MGSTRDSEPGVERVLDALTGFTDAADTLAGFAVTHPSARSMDAVVDRSVVEVRVYLTDRHPEDADRAMGMLQGHGYHPERRIRGGESGVFVCLTVPVDADGEPREWGEDAAVGGQDEQATF